MTYHTSLYLIPSFKYSSTKLWLIYSTTHGFGLFCVYSRSPFKDLRYRFVLIHLSFLLNPIKLAGIHMYLNNRVGYRYRYFGLSTCTWYRYSTVQGTGEVPVPQGRGTGTLGKSTLGKSTLGYFVVLKVGVLKYGCNSIDNSEYCYKVVSTRRGTD